MPVPVASSLAGMAVPRIAANAGPSAASAMGLANAPFLSAPQVSPENPIGAPQMGLLGQMRSKFASFNPMQREIFMRALGGSGEMPPGGRGGMHGDDWELQRQRLGAFGALPGQMGPMSGGRFGGGSAQGTYPTEGMMTPPTAPRQFPTTPVSQPDLRPNNVTAPQLISRLGNTASMIRNRLGGY